MILHENSVLPDSDASPSIENPSDPVSALGTVHFRNVNGSLKLYRWSATLSSTLIRLRSHFSGDLDQLVIYLVFAMGELARKVDGGVSRGVNALSVADITSIPRETTRRKLRGLASLGYLRCDPNGLWYLDDEHELDFVTGDLSDLLISATG